MKAITKEPISKSHGHMEILIQIKKKGKGVLKEVESEEEDKNETPEDEMEEEIEGYEEEDDIEEKD